MSNSLKKFRSNSIYLKYLCVECKCDVFLKTNSESKPIYQCPNCNTKVSDPICPIFGCSLHVSRNNLSNHLNTAKHQFDSICDIDENKYSHPDIPEIKKKRIFVSNDENENEREDISEEDSGPDNVEVEQAKKKKTIFKKKENTKKQ